MRYDRSRSAAELRRLASLVFLVCLGSSFSSVFEVSPLISIAVLFFWLRPDKPERPELYRSQSLWLVLLLLLLVYALARVHLFEPPAAS